MATAITTTGPTSISAVDPMPALVTDFFASLTESTRRAYSKGLEDFAAFLDAPDIASAASRLVESGPGPANHIALRYRSNLVQRDLAPATINLRLSALRSMMSLAQTLGIVSWDLRVRNIKVSKHRDTRGPGETGVKRLFATLAKQSTAKARRDLAILRLLFDLGLRRSSVTSLDLEHVDLQTGKLSVWAKGSDRRERTARTLPEPTAAALRSWLDVRGDDSGPLFTNLDRARKGNGRLTGTSVYRLVRRLGEVTGQRVRPHAMRHSAITAGLDATAGDVRAVAKFSGHKQVQTVLEYDDNRTDKAGEIARQIAEATDHRSV